MAKTIEPTFADTYGSVAMISAMWVVMAYAFMPLGPIAGLKKCSAGQKNWCAAANLSARSRAHSRSIGNCPARAGATAPS